MNHPGVPYMGAEAIAAALDVTGAVDALERALRDGLDVDADPPRGSVRIGAGELLVMASSQGAVKLVTVGGDPRIQGVCVVFDRETLAPAAILDGIALTNLRTAAVSALAVRWLAAADARRALVFGRGPQGRAHAAALRAVAPSLEQVDVVGRGAAPVVEDYDLIACCTTAREPLFDGARVADHAVVVAIGSHEPVAREVDGALAARATVVVESRATALHEAGDVVLAIGEGVLEAGSLIELGSLVRGEAPPPDHGRPRLFKSTGMAWEDAVVASAVVAGAA
jgi:ornithine cyclodeaminase/alanine dehydrogenase-like protein (mu-crystallin family)